jgi:hypothetical protein
MEVPCPVWLQGPWSPVGYQVVEVADDKPSATHTDPRADHCPEQDFPWSAPGYRVVEMAEQAAPAPKQQPAPAARAAGAAPRRKKRPLVRWGVVAAGGSVLLAVALVLVVWRSPAQVGAAPALAAAAPGEKALPPLPALTEKEDSKAEKETFGTAIGFVRNPAEAARLAGKQRKLMLVLHVSGNFEEARFT